MTPHSAERDGHTGLNNGTRPSLRSPRGPGECEHPGPCNEQTVARVPNPTEIAAMGLDICPFHLTLWADIRGDEETLREFGLSDLVA